MGEVEAGSRRWLFTKEALEHAQEAAHERASQALRDRRVLAKPLSLSQGSQLVVFYAQKLPELCKLCSAPSEVRWTALVFFKRFYAVSSPMEFDPLVMMYTSVHVACKVEEVREITLEKILEVSGFGDDPAMKTKVTDSELELLQRLGFVLLVQPQPGEALRVLAEEQRNFKVPSSTMAGFRSSEHVEELLSKAETLVYDLCISNDSLLLLPASIIFAAAWGAALDEGSGPPAGGTAASSAVLSMLTQNFKGGDKDAVARMMKEALHAMQQVNCKADMDKLTMQEIAKSARKCQRAFGLIHEERRQRSEAHRKERKRRRQDMKVPRSGLEELKRRAQVLQGQEDVEDDQVLDGPGDMED